MATARVGVVPVQVAGDVLNLRPTLKRRAQFTKPGLPGSQAASAAFVGCDRIFSFGRKCTNAIQSDLDPLQQRQSH